MNFPRRKRKPSTRDLLVSLNRKVDSMATTVEEVQTALTTLTTDLEGLATTAQAEFSKLEAEVAAGNTQPDLTPLKESIEAIDTKVKSAVVPTT